MTETAGSRRCEECGRDLPAAARPSRRFCSSRCRYRSWDHANRPEATQPVIVRLHWHVDRWSALTGDYHAGYWRGDGCPPECPGIESGWSTGVPEGREGISPNKPRSG